MKKTPWYEWWYFKVVLPETRDSFYAVYGIVNPWDSQRTLPGTRSYVGFGNFAEHLNLEQIFSLSDFSASYDSVDARIGDSNRMTDRHFTGRINDPIHGEQAWDVEIEKKWSFNAMGWGLQIPGLTNISWFPAQADASCTGWILSDRKRHEFKNAPCYQDRNWGTSFPDWWAWIVSNRFNEDPDAALALGGGLPEVLGKKVYSGVSVGLRYKGKEYSFRPNDLNPIQCDIRWGRWKVSAQNRDLKIEIEATAPPEQFLDLQFITPTGEIFHDYETLTGRLTLKIEERRVGGGIDILTSDFTGIEYGSRDLHSLETEMLSARAR